MERRNKYKCFSPAPLLFGFVLPSDLYMKAASQPVVHLCTPLSVMMRVVARLRSFLPPFSWTVRRVRVIKGERSKFINRIFCLPPPISLLPSFDVPNKKHFLHLALPSLFVSLPYLVQSGWTGFILFPDSRGGC